MWVSSWDNPFIGGVAGDPFKPFPLPAHSSLTFDVFDNSLYIQNANIWLQSVGPVGLAFNNGDGSFTDLVQGSLTLPDGLQTSDGRFTLSNTCLDSISGNGGSGSSSAARVYITNASGTISALDLTNNALVSTIGKAGTSAARVNSCAVKPDSSEIYIPVINSQVISVMNLASGLVSEIPLPGPAGGVAISPSGSRLYASQGNRLAVIDPVARALLASVPVQALIQGVAVSPDGRIVYATGPDADVVRVLDATTNTLTTSIPVDRLPVQLAVTADGATLVVATLTGVVSVVDTASQRLRASYPMTSRTGGNIAVGPDGRRIYVTHFDSDLVSAIQPGFPVIGIPVRGPTGVIVNGDGTRAYVVSQTTSSVAVIDTATNQVMQTIAVGVKPQGICAPPVSAGPVMAPGQPGVTFRADPSTIVTSAGAATGKTTLTWDAPGYTQVVIRIGSPTGTPMTGPLPSNGSIPTGDWATDGMQFFLVDMGTGNSLASVTVHVMVTPPIAAPTIAVSGNLLSSCTSAGLGQVKVTWSAPGYGAVKIYAAGFLWTTGDASGSQTTGVWVNEGMVFMLADSRDTTLTSASAKLGCSPPPPPPVPPIEDDILGTYVIPGGLPQSSLNVNSISYCRGANPALVAPYRVTSIAQSQAVISRVGGTYYLTMTNVGDTFLNWTYQLPKTSVTADQVVFAPPVGQILATQQWTRSGHYPFAFNGVTITRNQEARTIRLGAVPPGYLVFEDYVPAYSGFCETVWDDISPLIDYWKVR